MYEVIRSAATEINATVGGPTRIANKTSARVRAEQLRIGLSIKRQSAAAANDATALMVSSVASARLIPSDLYITDQALRRSVRFFSRTRRSSSSSNCRSLSLTVSTMQASTG